MLSATLRDAEEAQRLSLIKRGDQMQDAVLEMKNIVKSFPGVKALDGVNLTLRKGTVHALMGENGAGKSTLMKCLFGIYHKDAGEIYLEGESIDCRDSKQAIDMGISMIHQELQPIPMMTIAENIFLGKYPRKNGLVDHARMNEETKKYLEIVGLKLPPTTLLGDLTISQQQSVEIAKAISHNAKVVIMDEPTSSLTSSEVDKLFKIIRNLCDSGVGVIYISHKMAEILEIADDVTIMRDGQYVGTYDAKNITTDEIITRMVGRELTNQFPQHTSHASDEIILSVKDFSSPSVLSFQDCNFELHRGEILGVGGLVGAQRTELMEAIYGLREHLPHGSVSVKGKQVKIRRPQDAIRNGIALVTEDRRGSGIFGVLSVADNVAISSVDNYVSKIGLLNLKAISDVVSKSIDALRIKTPSQKTQIQNLSGGNQQKVILSRWLANSPDILILDEPTRGIDVGAKYEIYEIILDLVKMGKSIIMITSEMAELLGMSDRIMVMCEGRISGYLSVEEATQEKVMKLATQFMNKASTKTKQEQEEEILEGNEHVG